MRALVIKLRRQVEAEVRTSGSIVVVRFAGPIEVNVDKLWEGAPDFVGSARTDPDGSAIRLALARKATPNVMMAGERLFIDLLPDTWSGPPPSLPQDVIKELADRAKEAEKLLRQREASLAAKKRPPLRVRASTQPTFTRYVFELPDGAGVSTILNKERLTLNFNSGLTFDLADAKVAAAPNITSIVQKIDGDNAVVEFALIGEADIHSFRGREELHRRYRHRYQAGRPAKARSAEAGCAAAGRGRRPPRSARAKSSRRHRRISSRRRHPQHRSRRSPRRLQRRPSRCAGCTAASSAKASAPPAKIEPPKGERAEAKPDAEIKSYAGRRRRE